MPPAHTSPIPHARLVIPFASPASVTLSVAPLAPLGNTTRYQTKIALTVPEIASPAISTDHAPAVGQDSSSVTQPVAAASHHALAVLPAISLPALLATKDCNSSMAPALPVPIAALPASMEYVSLAYQATTPTQMENACWTVSCPVPLARTINRLSVSPVSAGPI